MALTYEPIFTTTLGSAASITISSIPQTYTDLVLSAVLQASGTPNQTIYFRVNGISTGSYNWSTLVASSTGVSYDNSGNQGEGKTGNTGTGSWGGLVMEAHDYTNTDINRVFTFANWRSGTSSTTVAYEQGVWMNTTTAALTSLTLPIFTWVANSTITLWGIKEA